MKAVIQRVDGAVLSVEGQKFSQIERGLCVYLGVENGDTAEDAAAAMKKIVSLRIFSDAAGKMNLSVKDLGYQILLISQFTLAANISRGNRPAFDNAESPQKARELYEYAIKLIADQGVDVKTGVFGADMAIEQVNAGPVTIILNCKNGKIN